MFTLWSSLIQSKIDYRSQLWNFSDQVTISTLEGVARSFTSRIKGMDKLNNWERLEQLENTLPRTEKGEVPDYIYLEDLSRACCWLHPTIPTQWQEGSACDSPYLWHHSLQLLWEKPEKLHWKLRVQDALTSLSGTKLHWMDNSGCNCLGWLKSLLWLERNKKFQYWIKHFIRRQLVQNIPFLYKFFVFQNLEIVY